MKTTTLVVKTTIYTLSSGRDVKGLTDDERLALRVQEIQALAKKSGRKVAAKVEPRKYPRTGASQTTAEYVLNYYLLNAPLGKRNASEAKKYLREFFQ